MPTALMLRIPQLFLTFANSGNTQADIYLYKSLLIKDKNTHELLYGKETATDLEN